MQDDFEDFPLFISVSIPVCVAASELCPVWIAILFAVVFGPFITSLVFPDSPFIEFNASVRTLFRFKDEERGKSSTQSWKSSSAYAIESCLLPLFDKNVSELFLRYHRILSSVVEDEGLIWKWSIPLDYNDHITIFLSECDKTDSYLNIYVYNIK